MEDFRTQKTSDEIAQENQEGLCAQALKICASVGHTDDGLDLNWKNCMRNHSCPQD